MRSGIPELRGHYVRIADDLREQIITGRLPVGRLLPPYSAISTRYAVSVATAQRAVGVLRDEGYVASGRGRGTFVVSRAPASGDPTTRILDEVFTRLDSLAAEVSRLQKLVDQGHQRHRRGRPTVA